MNSTVELQVIFRPSEAAMHKDTDSVFNTITIGYLGAIVA